MAIHRHRWVSVLLAVLTVLALGAAALENASYSPAIVPRAQAQEDGTSGPDQEASPEASPSASPAAPVAAAPPESQVFALTPWRFTIISARFGDAIPEVELSARSNRDWALVVLDVTNWDDEEADLRWRDFGMRVAGDFEGGGFAPQTTQGVATSLGLEPRDVSQELAIDTGDTVRVALVFQVADGGRDPALALNGVALPLRLALADSPAPIDLPPLTSEPRLETMRVARISNGETIRVGEGNGQPIRLAGVDAPAREECFGTQSTDRLKAMAGSEVLIERVTDDEDAPVYVWVDAPDNTRRLLNYEIVGTGFAAATGANDPRFQAWLTEAEHQARYGHLGLWFGCTGLHGVARPEEPEPSVLEAEADGLAAEYVIWTAWSPEIVGLPNGSAWAFFSADTQEQAERKDLRLYASRFDPVTGRWSRAQAIPGGRVQMGASAVVDAIGRVHIVYTDRRADETDEPSRLRYITENDQGGWTEPIDIAADRAAGYQLAPSLAIDDLGVLHVVWQDQRAWQPSERIASTSNADIFMSSLAPGGTWSEPVMISVHVAGQVSIRPKVVADGNRLVAVWSVYSTSLGLTTASRIEWSTLAVNDPEATWRAPETLVAGRGESFGGRLFDLQADPTGGVAFAFGRQANDTFLFLRRLESESNAWGSDILITYGQRGAFPSLAINDVGTTYVVYNIGEGRLVDVGATALAHDSVNPGPEVNLTANEPETQGLPVVTVDNTGAPWIVYFNQTPDGVANEVKTLRAPVTPLG